MFFSKEKYTVTKVTKEKILEVINTNIEDHTVTTEQLDDDLSNIGMDSIRFIQIIVSLEELFECEFPDSKLLLTEMNTVNKIYEELINVDKNTHSNENDVSPKLLESVEHETDRIAKYS